MRDDWEALFYGEIIDRVEQGERFQDGDLDIEEPEAMVEAALDYLTGEIPELEREGEEYILTDSVRGKDVEYEPGIKDKEKLALYALEELEGSFDRYDVIKTVNSYLTEKDAIKRSFERTSKSATAADHLSNHQRAQYGSKTRETAER